METSKLVNIPTIFLTGWAGWSELQSSVQALLMGHLVDLYRPYMDRYTSDLFHDARWIRDYVNGEPIDFYFGCDAWGTAIGTDPILLDSRKEGWLVQLTCEKREHSDGASWYVKATQVKHGGEAV